MQVGPSTVSFLGSSPSEKNHSPPSQRREGIYPKVQSRREPEAMSRLGGTLVYRKGHLCKVRTVTDLMGTAIQTEPQILETLSPWYAWLA